ncbi:MAG: RNA polymerase factor sigma-54 [Chromatiaceae bacterium]|jgi:RNA polymerase sigma-54 factor|nr:RNA polymerase factor sigma-54 [Chromatiaceae bacterium]
MKQSIQLRLGQQLTMTPQLQQAIRLLQLSTLDLHQEIQQALDSNLMLETDDEAEPVVGAAITEVQEPVRTESDVERELAPETLPMPEELPVDSDWSDHFDTYLPSGGGGEDGSDFDLFAQQTRAPSLQDHLNWQINLSRLEGNDLAIATAIVDGIDADGYLRASPEEILATVADDEIDIEEVLAVLHRIQSLDPPGVGARDLRECLLLQLRQLPADTRSRDAAIAVCEHQFEALTRTDRDGVCRQLGLTGEELAAAIALIRTLNPRPGAAIAEAQTEYVIPDVFVRRRDGGWYVELNPEATPKLRVNADYARLIRRADKSEDNAFLRSHLQEARWFIKSLASRNDTVLRVAAKIVELQRDFLEYGEEAMRPLVLRDVAEALELHESTVSRVTTQKYMHTPRGTFEFKFFFSSHVGTAGGGECSSTAIRAFIRKLVAAEKPNRPLSDSRIASVLDEQGIKVARRTVAKYREAMGIPPSNERRRLA